VAVSLPNLTLWCSPSNGLTVATVAAVAGAASSPAGIIILFVGTVTLFVKWIFDVYQNTYVPYFGSDKNIQLDIYLALKTLRVSWRIS
jgi:hypothetical protein